MIVHPGTAGWFAIAMNGGGVNDTRYCAIIGDIDSSRTLSDRAQTQNRFEETLAAINDEFRSAIASRFLVTIGDEFQGLLHTPTECLHIVRAIQSRMAPVPLSFGFEFT